MGRIATSLIVACMAENSALRDWANMILIGSFMGRGSFAESIAILTNAELPNPAFAVYDDSMSPIVFHLSSRGRKGALVSSLAS